MNYKALISSIVTVFAGVFSFSAYAQPSMKPMAAAALQRGMISIAISFIVVSFLFYIVMNIAKHRLGALQAALILFGSYFLGSLTFLFYSLSSYSFVLVTFSFIVLPLLLQIGSWFLLFKQHGWATVLLLCGISLLFPILFLSIGSLLVSFFGPGF